MTPSVATPRIRGRGAELAALDRALGRVTDGQPAITVLQGEAGIGKTSVLAQAQQA
jgi:predicted ATPase